MEMILTPTFNMLGYTAYVISSTAFIILGIFLDVAESDGKGNGRLLQITKGLYRMDVTCHWRASDVQCHIDSKRYRL